VLDNRIAELDAERAPVAEHVTKLEGQLRSMYDEMVAKFNRDKDASLESKATRDRLASVLAEIKHERSVAASRQHSYDALLGDLQALHRSEDRDLRHGINSLAERYVSRNTRVAPLKTETLKRRASSSATPAAASSAAAVTRSSDVEEGGAGNPELLHELLKQREQIQHAHEALVKRVAYLSRIKEEQSQAAVRDNSTLLEINNEYRREVLRLRSKLSPGGGAVAHVQGAAPTGSLLARQQELLLGSHEASTTQILATPVLRKGPSATAAVDSHVQHVRPGRLSASTSALPALTSGPGSALQSSLSLTMGLGPQDRGQATRLAALQQLASSVDRVVGLLPPDAFADKVLTAVGPRGVAASPGNNTRGASLRSSHSSASLRLGSTMPTGSAADGSGEVALHPPPPLLVRPLTSRAGGDAGSSARRY
jgi:hypothetical protein